MKIQNIFLLVGRSGDVNGSRVGGIGGLCGAGDCSRDGGFGCDVGGIGGTGGAGGGGGMSDIPPLARA